MNLLVTKVLLTTLVTCMIASNADPNAVSAISNTVDECMNGGEDVYFKVKLLDDDDSPYVSTRCSNGYMIIDVNHDSNWLDYFSTYINYHHSLIGATRDDIVNWDEWFLPDMNSYIISPDCQTCDESHILNQDYSTQSSYYMNPANHGCTQLPVGRIGCDMDFDTYECRACVTNGKADGYWENVAVYNGLNDPSKTMLFHEKYDYESYRYGLCGFTIRNSHAHHSRSNDTFEHCKRVTHEDTSGREEENIIPRRKPSLGTNGQFCVCAKPGTDDKDTVSIYNNRYDYKLDNVDISDINENEEASSVSDKSDNEPNIYELYQSDFEHGTYRIDQPGIYIIMEDIIFDFNSPDGWEDGNLDGYNGEKDWWPTTDDTDNYGNNYDGAGKLRGAYFMGFFAGISIEYNEEIDENSNEFGVILDLNGHKLAMSKGFFYQQSFFSLISLTSQSFLPGQGPGFFGPNPVSSKNVKITHGILGLSSHHGISGNYNKNILIENLKIKQFTTHGIQMSGFKNVMIKNVEVSHNVIVNKLSPFYAHLRHYLPIHRKMIEDNESEMNSICLDFNNRKQKDYYDTMYTFYKTTQDNTDSTDKCVTMVDLVHNIEILLDIAFEFAVFDKTEQELLATMDENTQKLWQINGGMLINSNRNYRPWTATLYGIFLNYAGSNVIGWYAGSENVQSDTILLENVKIHDLTHDTIENVAFSRGGTAAKQRILNCMNAPFNAYHVFGYEQVNTISECIDYENENFSDNCKKALITNYDGHNEMASKDNSKLKLKYEGNILTDIQIATFYVINEHGLSWQYCLGGAADVYSLQQFAMEGVLFPENTPQLAATHDPMIHPGKGVLGLRLNGVNNAILKNVDITDIVSKTRLGTLLANTYEFTVSQQLPYLRGFSMNQANGLSVTMCDAVVVDNVNIDNIKSDTGLAYGFAVWFDTHLTMLNSVSITNVIAGYELKTDANFAEDILNTEGYLPNKRPEACGLRVYYDDAYKVSLNEETLNNLDDILNVECVRGYQGCDTSMNEEITKYSSEWSSITGASSLTKNNHETTVCDKSYYAIKTVDIVSSNNNEIIESRNTFDLIDGISMGYDSKIRKISTDSSSDAGLFDKLLNRMGLVSLSVIVIILTVCVTFAFWHLFKCINCNKLVKDRNL